METPRFDRSVSSSRSRKCAESDLSLACENLVGFSTTQPSLFKRQQLLPVRDLKLLARDYTVCIFQGFIGFGNLTDVLPAYREKCVDPPHQSLQR